MSSPATACCEKERCACAVRWRCGSWECRCGARRGSPDRPHAASAEGSAVHDLRVQPHVPQSVWYPAAADLPNGDQHAAMGMATGIAGHTYAVIRRTGVAATQ